METFALFDDGSAARIIYGFLPPRPEGLPVQPDPIDITDPDVKSSATNGCLAAYHVLLKRGVIQAGEKFALSYQFATDGRHVHTMGKSAGLAFCLKFAQAICAQKKWPLPMFSIAATGEVSDGTLDAAIHPVGGISLKIAGAKKVLQPGDCLFLPCDKTDENTELQPVAVCDPQLPIMQVRTVEEAIDMLLAPLEIRGLGAPEPDGAYRMTPWCMVGLKRRRSFTMMNKGQRPIRIQLKEELGKLGWLTLSLNDVELQGKEERTVTLTLHPRMRLSFVNWKCVFRESLRVSLAYHFLDPQGPPSWRSAIQVDCWVVNPRPICVLPIIPIFLLWCLAGDRTCSARPLGGWQLVNAMATSMLRSTPDPRPLIHNVKNRLEWGEYLDAKAQVDRFLQCASEVAEPVQLLAQQMRQPLHLSIDLHHTGILRTGEGYKLTLVPDDDTFFYAIQVDADGNLDHVFPNPDFSARSNPLPAKERYQFPEGENWLVLDNHVGQETLYFVASRWPSRDIEWWFDHLPRDSPEIDQRRHYQQLIERFKAREHAQQGGVPGIFFKSYAFQHQ